MAKFDENRVVQVYRKLYNEFRNSLLVEFNEGRVKSSEYSNILQSLLSTAMQLAFQAPAEDYKICLLQAQTENTKRDTAYKDDMVLNELLSVQMNGWAEAFKSGKLDGTPLILSSDEISALYTTIKNTLHDARWRNDSCGIKPVEFLDGQPCSSDGVVK